MDIAEGKATQVTGKLMRISGIRIVDVVERQPDVVAFIEVPERDILAEITMWIISSVETMIEDLQLLPAHNGLGSQIQARTFLRGKNHERN